MPHDPREVHGSTSASHTKKQTCFLFTEVKPKEEEQTQHLIKEKEKEQQYSGAKGGLSKTKTAVKKTVITPRAESG